MTMTIEEMRAMVGTEFTYVFEDSDTIPAVVAAFDPEIGFTCLATEVITDSGEDFTGALDENGNLCLIGVPAKATYFLHEVSVRLREIKATGAYRNLAESGKPSCSF